MKNSVPLFTHLNPCPRCNSENYEEFTTQIRAYPTERHSVLKEYFCNDCGNDWWEEYKLEKN
jgi:YgiT-type zinc finger domain-containing protein